jgi:hypothetical protein
MRPFAIALALMAGRCPVPADTEVDPDTDTREEPDTEVDPDTDPGTDTDVDTEAPVLAGAAHGSLLGRAADGAVRLHGVELWLQRGEQRSESVTTGAFGDFRAPDGLEAGEWSVCARYAGWAACAAETVRLIPGEHSVGGVVVDLPAEAVAGRLRLLDGSPCFWEFPFFDEAGAGEVLALDEGEAPLPVTPLAADGGFVVFEGPPGPIALAASCEAATVEAQAEIGAEVGPLVELVVPNEPIRIHGLVPHVEGKAVWRAAPEQLVTVVAVGADDSSGGTVTFLAADGTPLESRGDRATAPMTAEVPLVVWALARDGAGGFDLASATIRPSAEPALLAVHVVDEEGAPVAEAEVRVGEAVARTDARGFVAHEGAERLAAEDGSLTVIVSGPGLVTATTSLTNPEAEITVPVARCAEVVFDPTVAQVLSPPDGADRLRVHVPASSLVDADGAKVTEPVRACLAAFGPDRPLPTTGRTTAAGDALRRPAQGAAAFVDFRLDADPEVALDFASPRLVVVELLEPPPGGWPPVERLRPFMLPTGADRWDDGVGGVMALPLGVGGPIPHPGVYQPAAPEDVGCVRLWADLLRLRGSGRYVVRITNAGLGGPFIWQVLPLESVGSRLAPLPARTTVTIDIVDLSQTHLSGPATWSFQRTTGSSLLTHADPFVPGGLPSCDSEVVVPPDELPSTGVDFLGRRQLHGAKDQWGHKWSAEDLDGTRTNHVAWRNANGWGSSDAWAAYRNEFDLGFGRAMRARRDPATGDVAMIVHNFDSLYRAAAHVGCVELGGPANANACHGFVGLSGMGLSVAVAMEYRADPGGGAPYTRFFAYGPSGQRITHVDLDGRGEKYLPHVCLNCHGGYAPDDATLADAVALTGQWPSADLGARFLPFALESFGYGATPPSYSGLPWPHGFERADQEAMFLKLNELVLATNLNPEGAELIRGWYGAAAAATTLPTGRVQDSHWRPPGLAATGWDESARLYDDVVRPYCRGCHLSFPGLTFGTADSLRSMGYMAQLDVCEQRVMPHALRTYDQFWSSRAPYAPGVLLDELRGHGGFTATACPY